MQKEMPPPAYAAHPPQYGHPSTHYGQPPPVITAPQPAYNPYPSPNNNMTMNNTVTVPTGGYSHGGGTTIIRTQRGNNGSCCAGHLPNFNDMAGKTTGLIMLSGGVITIIVITISLIVRSGYEVGGLGASIGAAIFLYIPTGILGVCSHGKSSCVVTAFLIMCILTALEAFAMTAYEGVAAGLLSYDYICEWFFCYWEQNSVVVAMHVIACIIAFVIFIAAIVGSGYSCAGMNGAVGDVPATMVVTHHPVQPTVQATTTTHTSSTYGGSHTATSTTYY
ncbi:uncharacterized protein LOC135156331 [Lytechinus pictus]|uniref:uncharacterized protein LOC135156331 n=1 Tax=Lytechinus pictus TaxID=7653 RepID=UPI0030B9F05A